jgi:microcystin degradation protein MlrC
MFYDGETGNDAEQKRISRIKARRKSVFSHSGVQPRNARLLTVAGAGVHLRAPLVVIAEPIEHKGCAEL